MSEFFQRLRRQAKELNALERDLRVRPEEKVDWERTTMSSAVVGLGTPVERSFLAEYFLTTWTEWQNLYDRYPRYFGRPPESLPRPWHSTAYRCRERAGHLLRDGSLGNVLASSWEEERETELAFPPARDDGAEVAVMYRSMVRNHLRLSALSTAATEDVVIAEGYSKLPVYEESKDDIACVVHDRELLIALAAGSLSTSPLRTLMRPITHVPENKKISELLRQMQREKFSRAIVVDESVVEYDDVPAGRAACAPVRGCSSRSVTTPGPSLCTRRSS